MRLIRQLGVAIGNSFAASWLTGFSGAIDSLEVGSSVLQGRSEHGRIGDGRLRGLSPNFIHRSEQKYELTVAETTALEDEISRCLPVYEFNPGHPYTHITTVYYDTPELLLYQRACRKYDDNLKIRVKEYYYMAPGEKELVSPYCFIELKRRRDGMVSKQRLRIPKEHLQAFIGGEDLREELRPDPALEPGKDEKSRKSFDEAYDALRGELSSTEVNPVSVINYRRRVYQRDEQDLRVTFDDRITAYLPPVGLYGSMPSLAASRLGEPVGRAAKLIAEIKCRKLSSGSYPGWLEVILCSLSARSLSKFTTSVNFILNKGRNDRRFTSADGEAGVAARVDGPVDN